MSTPCPPSLYNMDKNTHFGEEEQLKSSNLDFTDGVPSPPPTGGCSAMNNGTGRGGGHWACAHRERKREREKIRGVVPPPPSLLPPPISFLSPPLTCSPNPLAAGRTAEGQREKKRSEAEGDAGVGCLDVHEHADRRVCR